ncbi:MAG: hypothetical protein KAU28_01200 [Phycisphaerae bacterium]|nr:hypothetical protein [Phycisphaerae bacterium]
MGMDGVGAVNLFGAPPESSERGSHWGTPRWLLDRVQAFYRDRVIYDPCPLVGGCGDGLQSAWTGSVYVNPPYGPTTRAWVLKAAEEFVSGRAQEVILLLKAATDAKWWRYLSHTSAEICFIRGRLRYDESQKDAPFASLLVYLGPRRRQFRHHFRELGPLARFVGEHGFLLRFSLWWDFIRRRLLRWCHGFRYRCSP